MERGLRTRDVIIDIKEVDEEEGDEEEEEDEKICRICHGPGDSQNPLQYPCACSGSIKFVHSKCLLHWMKQRITFECEVCKHKYSVYRVYAQTIPTKLTLRELVGGIAVIACHLLRDCVSVLFRLLVVPYIAFRVWRSNSIGIIFVTKFRSNMSPSTLMMDWLFGIGFVIVVSKVLARRHAIVIREDNAYEIGEDAGELQAIADLRNAWLRLLKALFQWVRRLMVIFFRIIFVSFEVLIPWSYRDVMCCVITYDLLIFVPLPLGRILLHCLSWFLFAASSILMPFIEPALFLGNYLLNDASHAATNLSAKIQNDGLLSGAIEVVAETLTVNSTGPGEALSSVGKPLSVYRSSGLYDGITLATGCMVVVPLVFVCHGVPIRTVASKIRYYLKKFLTLYTFILIIHLGVLPLVYGWWLDVCTIMMTGQTLSDRVEFFSKSPMLSSSLHWMVGIIYMFQIHISPCLLQKVLHKEVLRFLRDFADPFFYMFRVLTGGVQVQASRILLSIVFNGCLIVSLVYLPAALAMQLAPAIFPLHISVSVLSTEIPAVMLLLQTLNSTVNRFTCIAGVTIIAMFFCARRYPVWLSNLHDSIRDDRYSSLGLQNFGEAGMQCEYGTGKLRRWLSRSQGL